MDIESKNLLTPNELTFILIGTIVDISVVSLPNTVTAIAKQDGWISVIIGAVYPLYIAFLAIYVSKRFPRENILILSKRYLGKILGTLLNFIFLLSFFAYLPNIISNIAFIIRTEVMPTLSPLKIYAVLLLMGAYASSRGIKALGRICSITFFILIASIFPSITILRQGNILNVSPIFGVGFTNILKGAAATVSDYSMMEIIFLIYPFINDNSKIKSASLKAVGFIAVIYTWITFIDTYYLGTRIISKTTWSAFSAIGGIQSEIINNITYIFISFWIFVGIKTTAIFNFSSMFIFEDIKNIKNKLIVYVVMGITIIIITLVYYGDLVSANEITKYATPIGSIYNITYLSLITALIWTDKGGRK